MLEPGTMAGCRHLSWPLRGDGEDDDGDGENDENTDDEGRPSIS